MRCCLTRNPDRTPRKLPPETHRCSKIAIPGRVALALQRQVLYIPPKLGDTMAAPYQYGATQHSKFEPFFHCFSCSAAAISGGAAKLDRIVSAFGLRQVRRRVHYRPRAGTQISSSTRNLAELGR